MLKKTPTRSRGRTLLQASRLSAAHGVKAEGAASGGRFSSSWMHLLGLAAIAGPLFLFRLGTGALLNWDEAIYAEVSKEMARSGNWLTPFWQGRPFFEKPPLAFWIQGSFFHWFGVNEFVARAPSALAGIAVVLLTYAIARKMAGATAGLIAALVLMTTSEFDRVARQGMTDALLCLCIYAAIYAWIRLRKEEPGWFYVACAAVGAGAMIKGPAVLVAPLAIGVDWMLRRPREKALGWRAYGAGGLLMVAMVAPWHIWMAMQYGRPFVSDYFGLQLAERATEVLQSAGGGPGYYAGVVLLGALPWSVVAVVAAGKWVWRREWDSSLVWILVGILLIGYSLLPTKHRWYILPVFPALAIEVGRLLAEAGRRWRMVLYASAVVVAAGLIGAFTTLVRRQGDPITNQVAQMAAVAGKSGETGPLYLVKGSAAEPELEVPTTVFYSGRPTVLLSVPADAKELAGLMQCRGLLDALVEEDAVGYLAREYKVRRIAGNGAAAYVEVSGRR